jgi:hypothetical protein
MSFTTSYDHDRNYHGSIGIFLFKSVQPSSQGASLCRSSLDGTFGVTSVLFCRRCFFLQDRRRQSRPPTREKVKGLSKSLFSVINAKGGEIIKLKAKGPHHHHFKKFRNEDLFDFHKSLFFN